MKLIQQEQWVDDYLDYINVPLREPSLEYLTEITTAHLEYIPFENISTLLYMREYHEKGILEQDHKKFVNNLHQYHLGGTCYVINSSLNELLKQIGFETRYAMLGGGHVALLVKVPENDEEVYVDAGNGSPFFEPVHLETNPENVSKFGGIEVRLRPDDEPGTYKYHRYVNGKLVEGMNWTFDTRKIYEFDDFQPSIKGYFKPGGIFTSALRLQIWQLDQRRSLSLVNNKLTIHYDNGEVEKHFQNNRHELREIIDNEFKFPYLPIEDAIDVLNDMDVNIFEEAEQYDE